MNCTDRKRKERAYRQANGEKRVEVWLQDDDLVMLDLMATEIGESRQSVIKASIWLAWIERMRNGRPAKPR